MNKVFSPAVKLINHLRYPQKLILLGTIVVCIVLVLFSQIAFEAYKKTNLAKMELLGVIFNNQLIDTFEKIQQYRYLEATATPNSIEKKTTLMEKKSEIIRSINLVKANLEKLDSNLNDQKYFEQIKNSISVVEEKIDDISNRAGIVIDIRNLIVSVCDASSLTLDAEIDTYYLADSYCTKFPDLSLNETLIRNLAENIFYRREISATDKNKLYAFKVLMKEYNLPGIEQNQEKTLKKNSSLTNVIEPVKNTLMSEANLALVLLEETILNGKFNIEQQKFREQYTKLLHITHKFHEKTGETLAKLLGERIKKLEKIFYIELVIVVAVLFVFFYLFIGVYLSVIRSIYLLIKGTQKIAKGLLEEKVELETHDELSEIASSFNEMREKLLHVVQSLNQVVTDAKSGKLSNRIDLTGKEGFYKDLFNDINQMSSVFNDVIVDVSSVLDFVSKGNLTKKMSHDYEGAFGELKTYMDHAVDNLEKLLKDIKTATVAISHAVKEIVLGNNDLAKRTDQQAAALEETSASMEKITNTVKQNTENAKGVNDLSKSASIVALKGGSAVHQVVEMMNSINESIHEVSEISNVIDNIAFQTNILALNAAVEAARAGEQGRGFAVVATEIRNLALRSSDSAKDIKTLINTTVERITRGAKLVDEAGQTMTEVVTAVSNVTDIMSKMANASIEQSNGIEQIYIAINQIDLVTQQNSALVEQAARASESLEQQTQHMDELLNVFKVSPLPQEVLSQKEHIKQNYLKIERRKMNLPPPNGIERRKIKTAPPKSDEWTEF
ncbi:MAG TPA: methyl-accepting chemotaxis protein [Gammaproteobacteria bacterium]|nr:methyl-accepting chemotaxis protein [Gammaproteobacteria bacterium]